MAAGSRRPADEDPRLDLHGLRVREALLRLDRFLREQQAAGALHVQVVTGHGTGAIRSAVWEHLRGHPAVRSWQIGLHSDAYVIVELRPSGRGR